MTKVLKEIPIVIKNQHQLLNHLAEGYKSLAKALMEYIDNSFDSADDFFNEKFGNYERNPNINVIIDRKYNKITIVDNCQGMADDVLEGLGNSINDSEKKRREQKRSWVNGQFGLGAHAFRFFAQELIVYTKKINCDPMALLIDKDKPNAQLIEVDPQIADIISPSGTAIVLNGIDKTEIKHLKNNELKEDIETYFEMLLRRNVQVKIVDDFNELICQPFDYEKITGTEIKKTITTWHEGSIKTTQSEENGIIVNLKISTEKINRPPFFPIKVGGLILLKILTHLLTKLNIEKKYGVIFI